MTEGHTWLSDVLGVRPRTSWSNDPFGYSASQPYLLRHLGLSHMLIQRVHYELKRELARRRALEFYWRQAWDTQAAREAAGAAAAAGAVAGAAAGSEGGGISVAQLGLDVRGALELEEGGEDAAQRGSTGILCHIMPFYHYDIPYTCGPDPAVCCQFDYERMPGMTSNLCRWRRHPEPVTADNAANLSETILDQVGGGACGGALHCIAQCRAAQGSAA